MYHLRPNLGLVLFSRYVDKFLEMQNFNLLVEVFLRYWNLKIHEKAGNGTLAIFNLYFLIEFT